MFAGVFITFNIMSDVSKSEVMNVANITWGVATLMEMCTLEKKYLVNSFTGPALLFSCCYESNVIKMYK